MCIRDSNYPHTPGIDAAGTVAESSSAKFSQGDEVIVIGFDLGMNTSGGFGAKIRVPSDWVVKMPDGLDLRSSMIIGTAGFTAAECIQKLEMAGLSKDSGPVLVTGATGGVGSVAVKLLAQMGHEVHAVTGKPDKKDALKNQQLWEQFGISASFPDQNASRMIEEADVLIDAIFGIGMEQSIEGAYREWIEIFNSNKKALKIAVDIPSGVSSDESRIFGVAAKCQHTITFQLGKPGCYQYPGAKYSGNVIISDISIPQYWPDDAPDDHEEPGTLDNKPMFS